MSSPCQQCSEALEHRVGVHIDFGVTGAGIGLFDGLRLHPVHSLIQSYSGGGHGLPAVALAKAGSPAPTFETVAAGFHGLPVLVKPLRLQPASRPTPLSTNSSNVSPSSGTAARQVAADSFIRRRTSSLISAVPVNASRVR